jgi:hypothetical protein
MITTAGHDRDSLLGKLHARIVERLEMEQPQPGLTIARDDENGGTYGPSAGHHTRPVETRNPL